MAWIWTLPADDKVSVVAEFDHKKSTFPSYKVLTDKVLSSDTGDAILRVKRCTLRRLLGYASPPTTSSAPIVNGILKKIISHHTKEDEIQFYPVKVVASDGETDAYSFAIPLNWVTCTDIAKSIITGWTVPNISAYDYDSLQHIPDCLGNKGIARDSVLRHILVSDQLRKAMLETQDQGLAFLPPECMRSLPF